MNPDDEARYEVVTPVSRVALEPARPSQALPELSGKTICELWDQLFKGDQMFAIIRQELASRYDGLRFVGPDLFGNTHGGDEEQVLAQLPGLIQENQCDAVISAVGS